MSAVVTYTSASPTAEAVSINWDKIPGFKHIQKWEDAHLFGRQVVVFHTDSPFYARKTAFQIGNLFCGYVISPPSKHDFILQPGDIVCGDTSSVPVDENRHPIDPDHPQKRLEHRLLLLYKVTPGQTCVAEDPCKLSEPILKTHKIAMRTVTMAELGMLEQAFADKTMRFYPNYLDSHETMFAYTRDTIRHMVGQANRLNADTCDEETYGNIVEYFRMRNLHPSDFKTKKPAEGKTEEPTT